MNNQTWYNYIQVVLYTGRLFLLYDISLLFHLIPKYHEMGIAILPIWS